MSKPCLALIFLISSFFITMDNSARQPGSPFEKEWKRVEEFVKKEQPQSALAEVKKIYALALKQQQEPQRLKCLIYMADLQEETREDNQKLVIREWEKELTKIQTPAKAVLQSLLAGRYWNYFQMNRWRLYQQTTVADYNATDIDTWSSSHLHTRITELFRQSLQDEPLLQKTPVSAFDAIILKGNSRSLRPTLFDLLAHQALDYFKSGESTLQEPTQAFELDLAAAFDPAADFVHRKFESNDSNSLSYQALLLYQRLVRFHLHDKSHEALIDVDLNRLQFVRNQSTHPDKDELYFLSINHIAHQYNQQPAAAQAWFLLAQYHSNRGEQYSPHADTSYRYEKAKALEISETILANPLNTATKDTSEGWYNARQLKREILNNDLNIQLELVNLPSQPFRALVSYKNVSTLQLRILRWSEELQKMIETGDEIATWSVLEKAPAIRQWQQDLPATADYQQHRVEIKIDGLENGNYLLLASSSAMDKEGSPVRGYGQFHISQISYIHRDNHYYVLHRETGRPLHAAQVQIWTQSYDSKLSRYTWAKGRAFQTDEQGYFNEKAGRNDEDNYYSRSTRFQIRHGADELFLQNSTYIWYPREGVEESNPVSLFLFTDRSLYRPGQTLFVKGIMLKQYQENNLSEIVAERKTKLYLRDANGQTVDSVAVKSNEYGSFSARFNLPSSGLTGMFTLFTKSEQGSASIRVEEYKRPKFEVSYEPIRESFRVGDSIRVTGLARAYAGNNIDGAKVRYRVVRQARFPYPWWGRSWWPSSEEREIAHGELTTDADGKFEIQFLAIPDKKIDPAQNPYFDYQVTADVTDINGETRSGETSITAAYTALKLDIYLPEKLPVDSLHKITVRTRNMADEFVPAKVALKVHRLKTENRLIRDRYWERPDQFLLSKQEYLRHFPLDEYDNESDYQSWEKEAEILQQSDSSRADGQWTWQKKNWPAGFYVLEFSSTDAFGKEVKARQFLELYTPEKNELNRPQYLWVEGSRPVEPGEEARVSLGSSAKDIYLLQFKDYPSTGKESRRSALEWKSGIRIFSEKITEADRGGFGLSWAFVKDNRFYQHNETMVVPWRNKDLNVEYLSWRDKTLPGSAETWTIRISGAKKDQVAAEVLASMYDASLDQFYPHAWRKPSIYPNYFNRHSWKGESFSFSSISKVWMEPQQYNSIVEKDYDQLQTSYNWMMPLKYIRIRGQTSSIRREEMLQYTVPAAVAEDSTAAYNFSGELFVHGAQVKKAEAETNEPEAFQSASPRKNFNETAFFFPDLRTDSSGAVEFSFTMPEALTRWKFQALAHNKELALGYSSREMVTQKELMLQPNPPRFLREGDQMEFSAKLVNLTDKEMTGEVRLELLDAATHQPLDSRFRIVVPRQYFTAAAQQSASVSFQLQVPFQFTQPITWRMVAVADKHSDGEEANLPVLSNRMLVTESLPLQMKGSGNKTFSFDKLKESGNSPTLQSQRLTVEYSSNPIWYVVQALPYLMEFPYECAEQNWNRYFANALAAHIANSSPRIRAVFEKWKEKDTAALISNLQKNQELKNILLEETPWVLDAQSETAQKENIARLFDQQALQSELRGTLAKLKEMQNPSGAFPWFKGGPDNRYITQYILSGIGHLQKLKALPAMQENEWMAIMRSGLGWLDRQMQEDYQQLLKQKTDLKKYTLNSTQVQYFYLRSFFPAEKITAAAQKAVDYFRGRLSQSWVKTGKYQQAMIALSLHRSGNSVVAKTILKSLKETTVYSEELGRYHKSATRSWWWYEAPLERQALMVEAFLEINNDSKTADEFRTWLLKNKQTNRWESTKATAEACYALLLQQNAWQDASAQVTIRLGSTEMSSTTTTTEEGTGYFKQSLGAEEIQPEMGAIALEVKQPAGSAPASSWGAVYWQYFEDKDKISPSATPLQLEKKLYVQKNTDAGPVLEELQEGAYLEVGDKLVVRIILKADREMEYLHMKDLRAAGMEPVNVLSGYKWQGGLGYYESTRDAATHFFFQHLRRGTYVFEYSLFASHAGDFTNGITSIECMYAPEFRAHSEGIRVRINTP